MYLDQIQTFWASTSINADAVHRGLPVCQKSWARIHSKHWLPWALLANSSPAAVPRTNGFYRCAGHPDVAFGQTAALGAEMGSLDNLSAFAGLW